MSGPQGDLTKALVYFAAICWGFVLVGAAAIAFGEPKAATAVVGAGVPGIVFTVGACLEHRSNRR